MKDPERLAHGHRSELVRTMLSAARDESPREAALQRTLSALGAGAAVLSATGAAAGIAAAGSGATVGATSATGVAAKVGGVSLVSTAVKWVGVGAVSGLLAAGVVDRVTASPVPEQTAAAPTAAAPRNAAAPAPKRAGEFLPNAAQAAEPEPERRPASQAAAKPSPPAVDPRVPLAAEVLAVDRAREAVAGGDPARALSEIDAYERRFGERRLAPEALFLRMEAHGQRGDQAAARATARQLLAVDPNGPHAARARAVLGGP